MAKQDAIEEARVKGGLEAQRELRRLGIDLSKSVDIFAIVTRQQLWMRFVPMENLLGVYLRGGMLINSHRPLSVQRLTAAHEYAHHVLRHDSSFDSEEYLGDPQRIKDIQEAEAQAFATDMLMPVQLVNALSSRLGIPDRVSAQDVYVLSLHLGTSYQATVYQMAALGKIEARDARQYLTLKPKDIKRQIGRGLGPHNPWAEVWPIGIRESGAAIRVTIDDTICLELPEPASSGYLWSLVRSSTGELETIPTEMDPISLGTSLLELVRSEFDVADNRLRLAGAGGVGSRYVTLRAAQPGETEIKLSLRRPWSASAPAIDEFTLDVTVSAKPDVLLPEVQKALAA